MSDYKQQAQALTLGLGLSMPPVAIAFRDELPADIATFDGRVAAGCEFWELASHSVFATSAKDHQLCSIGIHTHNIAGAPATHAGELNTTLQAMMGLDYIRTVEIAEVPVNQHAAHYVIYGPLSAVALKVDVVVLFANAQQGLIIAEAVERVDRSIPLAMGRPACAAIPQVMNSGSATLSLGCCGARAYLNAMTDTTSLWVLPGDKLEQYAEQIQTLAAANEALSKFHRQRKQDVIAGESPSVAMSLQRM